jgi:hypothetical protein
MASQTATKRLRLRRSAPTRLPFETHRDSSSRRRTRPAHLFTGTDVATGAVFSAIGLLAFRPAIDPDVFWHLATGKWIWRNHRIPKADPFSWTAPGRSWIAHEWLTEAIWRVVYRAGGWGALVILTGLILMATFALVHATARRLHAGPIASTLFTALSALAGLHTWNVRPQMISLAFSSLFGYWFVTATVPQFRGRSNDDRNLSSVQKLWWIPLVMIVWVNLHGGWVFGMAMLAAFAVSAVAESLLPQRELAVASTLGHQRFSPRAFAKTAVGIFLCSLLVIFVNPNGLKGVVYPFSYLGDNASTRYVNEWFAPSIVKVQYWPFFVLLLLFAFTLSAGLRKLPLYAYAIGLPFVFLAVQSARNVSQFAVFAAPFIAQTFTSLWAQRRAKTGLLPVTSSASLATTNTKVSSSTIGSTSAPLAGCVAEQRTVCSNESIDRTALDTTALNPTALEATMLEATTLDPNVIQVLKYQKQRKASADPLVISKINGAALVALASVSLGLGFTSLTTKANLNAQSKIYPVAAVQKLLADPGTKLLNDYDWGGYLTHVAPKIRVSIDGRPDMYGDKFTDDYVAMWRTNAGWQARLARFNADRLLAKPKSPMATKLRQAPEWTVVFEDNIAILFARR